MQSVKITLAMIGCLAGCGSATNDAPDAATPQDTRPDATPAHRITVARVGQSHSCVLLDTGAVRCWGNGQNGRLGYGDTDNVGDDEPPVTAGDVDVGGTVVEIATGAEHTCARL